jgi:hypothetical protein
MLRKILFLFIALSGLQKGISQITYKEVRVDYDSAWQFKDLKIIPVKAKSRGGDISALSNTISLNKALEQGLVTIEERGTSSVENVHWLSLFNHSNKNIYVSGGEILSGGRQDRMVTRDTFIIGGARRSDLHVMCVEEERWGKKNKKFTYEKTANQHLRKVLDVSGNQRLIWQEIHRQLTKDTIRNKTLAYLALGNDKKFVGKSAPYLDFFRQQFSRGDSTILGMVCISGDKIIGTDIFASTTIFYEQLIPLLKGYIEEVLVYGSPVNLPDQAVTKYMDNILSDEKTQEAFVKENGKLFKVKNKVVHITTY